MGVPVFAGRLDANGDPDTLDSRWRQWQDKLPSARAIDRWHPGDGLCAVTGIVFDVIDWDPRNDPDKSSWNTFIAGLGNEMPFSFWQVRTPRGGKHIYVATMGLGSHNGFLPGLDLKSGKDDGSGRGFVFLPPTSRVGGTYRPTALLQPYGDNGRVGRLRAFIEECLSAGLVNGSSAAVAGRQRPESLRAEVLRAEAGEQRAALLQLVHEYERRGLSREAIIELMRVFLPSVPCLDNHKGPWYPATGRNPDRWINTLFHKPGTVAPDGTAAELEGIGEPRQAGLVRSFAEVGRKRTSWLWRGYLARGEMTILDGEKGVSKSLIVEDVAARFTAGRILPGMDKATGEVHKTIIFTAESSAEKEVGPRLDAAGADVERVFCPGIPKVRKKAAPEWILPDGAGRFEAAIRECGATVAIFDPINDFLQEDINTNNDASIRRALMPLGLALAGTNCGGILIRHMNKNTGADARYRGAGTTAYQNRARIHLVAARIPEELRPQSGAMYGLAIVDNNLMRVDRSMVLAYDVVDSEIPASDEDDDYIPVIEWHGPASIDANAMVNGDKSRPVSMEFELIREVLATLFDKSDTWPSKVCWQEIRNAGYDAKNKVTVNKVRKSMGITPVRRMAKRGSGGVESWDWTTKTVKGRARSMETGDEG